MEINENQGFSACAGTHLQSSAQPSSCGDPFLPVLKVVSPSPEFSLISGLLTPGSMESEWDKYTGCEMKSILMSVSV